LPRPFVTARWEFTLGLVAAALAVASGHAQTGASIRVARLALNWIDSMRPEPWSSDTTDHRGILTETYYRAGVGEPAVTVRHYPPRS